MELRPYQQDAVSKIRALYQQGKRSVLYQAPCGSGKTVLFAYVAKEAAARGTRVLVLVHRKELLLQASRTLQEFGISHGIVAPRFPYTNHRVRVASIQTIVRRLGHVPDADLLVYDECHHGISKGNRKVIDYWSKARLLGVTATPQRLDGRGLGEIFQSLVPGPSIRSLVEQGYLAPCEVYAPTLSVDLSGVKTSMGDYDRHELQVRVGRSHIVGDATEHYTRLAKGRPFIAFCVSVEAARNTAEAFSAAGYPCRSIDGEMGDHERDGILNALRDGKILGITSCELVNEGLDIPLVEVGILMRPTQSFAVHIQQTGRPIRPAEGKSLATILDHAGNCLRLGLPDEDRVWSLDGKRRRKGNRPPPVARCPSCFACFPPGPAACPSCGALLPIRTRTGPEFVDGELRRVDSEAYMEARAKMRQQHMEQGRCGSYEELVALGRRRGYARPEGWAARVWAGRRQTVSA